MRSRWGYPLLLLSLIVVLALTIAALTQPARAQGARCGGFVDVLADLDRSFGEKVVWIGERGTAGHLVITAKVDGSTWTALLVRGEVACLAAAGTGWTARPAGENI